MNNINLVIEYSAENGVAGDGWLYDIDISTRQSVEHDVSLQQCLFVTEWGEILSVEQVDWEWPRFILSGSPLPSSTINEFIKLLANYPYNKKIKETINAINSFDESYVKYDFSTLDIPNTCNDEDKTPIYRGCPNKDGCYCTGACKDIVGYDYVRK